MTLLRQNAKMKKSSDNNSVVYNFGIPAYYSKELDLFTCPNAKNCISGCYARSGTYQFSNVVKAYTDRLKLVLSQEFVPAMIDEIEQAIKKSKGKQIYIRIGDSGDFFDLKYFNQWVDIMTHFKDQSGVKFYAYTKMVSMFKLNKSKLKGLNFHYVFSFGGTEDHLIDTKTDHHVKVFETMESSRASGYTDISSDDLITANSNETGTLTLSIVYHGTKKYSNTNWQKVG